MHGFISLKFHSNENDGIIFHMTATTHVGHYLHSTKHEYNIWYVFQVIHLCHNMGISTRFVYFYLQHKNEYEVGLKKCHVLLSNEYYKKYIFCHSIND
jgi:hypothetical protein